MSTEIQNIQIGDQVRSFDFHEVINDVEYGVDMEGDRASYIEGKVVGFQEVEGCNRYVIEVHHQVAGGKVRDIDVVNFAKVYPPVNGTEKMFGGVCNGVKKI